MYEPVAAQVDATTTALTLTTLFLAALAGSVWGLFLIARRQGGRLTAIPFGSLLAPAAMVVLLWGDGWVDSYMGLFR